MIVNKALEGSQIAIVVLRIEVNTLINLIIEIIFFRENRITYLLISFLFRLLKI
jgi:hypothetical protein